jgi:hypothetical protein
MIEVFIFFMVILILALIWEYNDRNKIPDLPDCKYITNYCNAFGEKNNIKYIVREQNNKNNKNESVDILLSKVENECCKLSKVVYWRMSLIISLIGTIFFWSFNRLGKIEFPINGYLFLLISFWFLNYWLRNYLDYHYHDYACIRVKESVEQIRKKLNTNK